MSTIPTPPERDSPSARSCCHDIAGAIPIPTVTSPQRAIAIAATLAVALTGCSGPPRPDPGAALPVAPPSPITHAPKTRPDAYPQIVAATRVAKPGYPPPPVATPTRDPAQWYPGEMEAQIKAALPPGARFDDAFQTSWHTDQPARNPRWPGQRESVYGIPYTLDGLPSVAAVSVRPPRLLWDLKRDGPTDLEPSGAWPINVYGSGPGIAVGTATGSWLLRLSFDVDPRVIDRLPLPKVDLAHLREAPPEFRERDVTGDAVPDPVLYVPAKDAAEPILAIYQRLPDGSVRLVHAAGRGAVLHDLDRDGLLDVISPDKSGTWTLWRWQDDAFVAAETVAAPTAPTPQTLDPDALPPLPANLTFHPAASGEVHRWPKEGGPLRTLWRANNAAGLRGFKVSADGGHVLYALEARGAGGKGTQGSGPQGPMPLAPVTLFLQDVGGAAIVELPTFGEVRDYEISADGQRVVYMGIGVGPDGATLPMPPPGGPHPRPGLSGTLFAVETADPTHFAAVGDCQAAEVQTDWTLDCIGDVALSPDASQVAYADARGLWVVDLPGGQPRLALAHYFTPTDSHGSRIYVPDRWSPNDQYLLVEVGGREGTIAAIVDAASGHVAEIPDSGAYTGHFSEFGWSASGDTLFSTRWVGDAPLRTVAAAAPDKPNSLWDTLPLHPDILYQAIGAAVAPDSSLRFALRQWEGSMWRSNGVFRSERDGTGVVMLAALPPVPRDDDQGEPGSLTWSSDGAAFLMRYEEGPHRVRPPGRGAKRALVGLADGSGLWDASEFMGATDWVAWSD